MKTIVRYLPKEEMNGDTAFETGVFLVNIDIDYEAEIFTALAPCPAYPSGIGLRWEVHTVARNVRTSGCPHVFTDLTVVSGEKQAKGLMKKKRQALVSGKKPDIDDFRRQIEEARGWRVVK